MTVKRIFFYTLVVCLVLAMCIVPGCSKEQQTSQSVQNTATTMSLANPNGITYVPNSQVYSDADGSEHTIYWAQGIEAPKMTSDESQFGQEGYFHKIVEAGTYVSYEAPMVDGKGYYDLNKNKMTNHCYLGAANNLMNWWLDQNKSYVDTYQSRLKAGQIYSQPQGLRPLLPYNEQLWQSINTRPTLQYTGDHYSQELFLDTFTKNLSGVYLRREDGYFMDKVWDYYINGYQSIDERYESFTEDDFVKDNTGGYFYPIFGKKSLSTRYETTKYDFFRDNLANLLNTGHGIAFAYFSARANSAHAITVWGAEYDENGELVRVYITDTDDFHDIDSNTNTAYGLHSMDVHANRDGILHLTTNTVIDNWDKPGAMIQNFATLSLAQDIWEERLQDITDPDAPVITKDVEDYSYALASTPDKMEVQATISDTGQLSYQWHESDADGVSKGAIPGANKPYYLPDVSSEGTRYYYVDIINNKNGKETVVKSRVSKVLVSATLQDAKAPTASIDGRIVKYNRYERPKAIYVTASSPDGGVLSYQWYKRYGGDSLSGGGSPIVGATENYYIPRTDVVESAFYYCVVTNTKSDATGKKHASTTTQYAKRVDILSSEVTSAQYPIIVKNPISATYNDDGIVVPLVVDATSPSRDYMTFQWYKAKDNIEEGVAIIGANGNTYTPLLSDGTMYYYCRITITIPSSSGDLIGSRDTDRALITINSKEPIVPELSSDNHLTSLDVNNATISPAFDKNITSYNAHVNFDTLRLDVVATPVQGANVNIINPDLIAGGATWVIIEVTAENGDKRAYTICVTKESDHRYGEWQIVTPATCVTDGLKRRVCLDCGITQEEVIPKTGHTYVAVITPPTCLNKGYTTYTCECGASYIGDYVDPLGHDFGDYIVTKEATCQEIGSKYRECSRCHEREVVEIEKLPHQFEASYDDTYHFNVCTKCGERKDIVAHSFDKWVVDKEPDADHEGRRHATCSCGYTRYEDIPALKHEYVTKHDATHHWQECTTCGNIINKRPHVHSEWTVTKAPTCTQEGTKTSTCECGYVKEESIPMLSHEYGDWVVVKAPTCTISGLKTKKCLHCDATLSEEIKPTGHNYIARVVPPTCTERGYTIYECSVCQDSYVNGYVDALGHDFGDWIVEVQPTCTTLGTKSRTCKVCGEKEIETLPALGHSYVEEIIPPTCLEQGYTLHTCEVCGKTYKTDYVEALGHQFGEWQVVKEPTYDEEGLRERVCVCGHKEVESIPRLERPTPPPSVEPETPPSDIPPSVEPETPPIETPPSETQDEDVKTPPNKGLIIGLSVGIPSSVILIAIIVIIIIKRRV